MARVVHFGVTNAARNMTSADVALIEALFKGTSTQGGLAAGFLTDGDSFSDWGEPLMSPDEPDALHVMHITECETYDADDERIRLSNDEVYEIANTLLEMVSMIPGYRVVEHWIEGDLEIWSDDNYIHGPFALASTCGKTI